MIDNRIFQEGNFWRWEFTDTDTGKTYVDGGNFLTKWDAFRSLKNALHHYRVSKGERK